jgi:hypothetical protein
MSEPYGNIGTAQGTANSSLVFSNIQTAFKANSGASSTPTINNEFITLVLTSTPSSQGTASGTIFPGSGAGSGTTSVQSVEG